MRLGLSGRALAYALTLLAAISFNFFLPRAMPGDPLELIAGNAVRQMGAERIEALRQQYGLDKPLSEQFVIYLGQLLRGDLGQSYRYSGGQTVVQVLADRFLWTFFLVTASLGLATFIGASLGVWAVWRRNRKRDLGLLTALFTLRSVPPFWLAMLLIPLLAVRYDIFPTGDSYSIPRPEGWAGVVDVLHHAALPIIILTLAYVPTAFALMRTSMLGLSDSDFVRTARSKGLQEGRVVTRHALRVALLPLLTALALEFGQLLGGVTLIETVFNYRGLGNMMFEAVKSRDYPLLQGGFLLFTLGVLAINLMTDWLYPRLDPRVRGGEAGS